MSGTTPRRSKRFETAKEKQSQDINLEALKELKKSLICSICERFPRPGSNVYTCKFCEKIVCSNCYGETDWICTCDALDPNKRFSLAGPILSKLVSLFKQSLDIDLEALKELKKSLICSDCERFPRPGSNVYTCKNCEKIVCSKCWDGTDPNLAENSVVAKAQKKR